MAKINLLPWRQALRKQRQQEFVAINIAVALVAVGLVLAGYMALQGQISDQDERNTYIKGEITNLDKQIKEIDELQKRRDELMARMKIIQDLQGRRPVVVRVFDEFVRALPDGVYFKTLERSGDTFKITGVAESKNEVSNLMRNLDASPWFKNPVLSGVVEDSAKTDPAHKDAKKPDAGAPQSNSFTLSVQLEGVPDQSAAKDDGKGAAKTGATAGKDSQTTGGAK